MRRDRVPDDLWRSISREKCRKFKSPLPSYSDTQAAAIEHVQVGYGLVELNIPIRVPEAFRVIAHRGSSAYAPENSLPAFRLAREMGVGEVELDVQLAIDGVVVLCHDLVRQVSSN